MFYCEIQLNTLEEFIGEFRSHFYIRRYIQFVVLYTMLLYYH